MREHEYIDQLVGDLKPVKPARNPFKFFCIWTVANLAFLFAAFYFTGGLREGWSIDLFSNWRFTFEIIVGIIVSVVSGYFLFKHAIPEETQEEESTRHWPMILLFGFSGILTLGVVLPPDPTAFVGGRAGCLMQLIGFSIPPLLILLYHLGQSAPVNLLYVGFLAGIAAGAPFATAMHLACMYEAKHVLIFHIFPVIVLSLVSASVARLFVKWWK